jgi:hypothetical protein
MAIDCPDIRIDRNGGSMEHVPPVNQGDVGTCYAAAAAQIIDAWRNSHESRRQYQQQAFLQLLKGNGGSTSGLMLAVGQAAKLKPDYHSYCNIFKHLSGERDLDLPYEGGDGCAAFNEAMTAGTCDQQFLMEALHIPESTTSGPKVREALDKIQSFDKLSSMCGELNKLNVSVREEEMRRQTDCDPAHGPFPHTPTDRLHDIVRESITSVEREGHDELLSLNSNLQKLCAGGYTPPDHVFEAQVGAPKCKRIPPHSGESPNGEELKTDIRKLLSKKESPVQPIGIMFSTCFLKSETPLTVFTDGGQNGAIHDCGIHEALIIGSRPNPRDPRKCEYLVRNSWGRQCSGYSSRFQAGCESKNGSIWVDENEILGQSIGIEYLKGSSAPWSAESFVKIVLFELKIVLAEYV